VAGIQSHGQFMGICQLLMTSSGNKNTGRSTAKNETEICSPAMLPENCGARKRLEFAFY